MMRAIINLILIIIQIHFYSCDKVDFTGWRVYHVTPTKDDELHKLYRLELNPNYIFWTDIHPNRSVDLMVSPKENQLFLDEFNTSKLYISDVQTLIENERPQGQTKYFGNRTMSWDDYYTYDEINNWMISLTREFPDKVKLLKVGKSYQGRQILGVHVSFNEANSNKGILLESGIHAREWIGVAAVTYQLNEILRSSDPRIRKVVENYDWYILPIYNPDGYVYTFTTNRMWRKTRQRHGICIGADPNRNWDYNWHLYDYNYINPCSESYAGPRAFSEPETKQISEYLKSIGPYLLGYISHHAYSQLLLLPYGDSAEHRDNYDELYSVALKMTKNIEKVHGTKYRAGNIVEILYRATGNDVDWVKHNLKTRITYVYELRDTGKFGFLLPANQIIPTGEEITEGLITMLEEFEKLDAKKLA